MKKLTTILFHLSLLLFTFVLSAAIPQRWTVETSRVQPAQFEGFHGETIEFAATMQSYGKPLAITNDLIGIYWQTNGMGSAYWTYPAVLSNNVMIARWTPEMDVGANVYSCFIGAPGEIYRAAFQLRLRPSPGAVPSELPLPVKTLDFAQVQVLNAPYYSKSETDAKIIELAPAPGNYATVSNRAMTAVQPSAISDMETKTHAAATYLPMSDPTIAGAFLEWDGGRLKLHFGDFYAEWISVDGANIGGKSIYEIVDDEIDGIVPGYMWDFQDSIYNTPTTLSGYGITDAKIQNGTITLGSQSITPLTSFTESDPTVPSWAKATTKPSYSWSEIGSKPSWIGSSKPSYSGSEISLTGVPGNTVQGFAEQANTMLASMPSTSTPILSLNDGNIASGSGSTILSELYISGKKVATENVIEAHDASETAHTDIRNTVNNLADNVSTWSSFWSGDDVRVTVTNYDSAVNLPSLYLEYKLSNGLFRTVWDERTRWDTNELRMAALESAIEGKADRAWGYYDSHTGGWAPDGYTWLSSPKIAISGGLAYQKHVTSEGAVWVLESNGLIAESGGVMSNGFFRISDDEGNPLFEIVKGDKRTVGATAGSCEPLAGYAITHLQIGYAVESADHPKIYVTRSLTPVDWKDEEDADCPATVNWSGSSGNWTAVVAGKVAEARLFVKAEYEVGGNTYIKQSAPVSVQKLVLGGNEYRVGTATISGHTVLTLTLEP